MKNDPHFQAMVMRLYREMPGATGPYMEGPLENEHCRFCEAIALEIISAAQGYAR